MKQKQPFEVRSSEDMHIIKDIDLNHIAGKHSDIWQSFVAYCDEFLTPGWLNTYTESEHKFMFYLWMGGFCTGTAVYEGAKEQMDKPERKIFLKKFRERLESLMKYIDTKINQEIDQKEQTRKDIIQSLERTVLRRSSAIRGHAEFLEALKALTTRSNPFPKGGDAPTEGSLSRPDVK